MKEFSSVTRTENISKLQNEKFDLLIIGGGITGAGTARDAAQRGLRVALIEASDFASGTSSRSSKLIHGGIRYLENLEFNLVFEALSERAKLFKIAPHLVHPLRFMLPLYKSGRVGMFKMGLGMWLYDSLSLFRAPKMHEKLSSEETMARMPLLKESELLGSVEYSDAYMDDDRLVHETLRSANDFGAICTSYVKATGAKVDDDGIVHEVAVYDMIGKSPFNIKAEHIISCVGPWTDELGEKIHHHWKKILRPTKGVHLTFERERFPLPTAVVMAAEKRIVFGIPRHEMVIVGTTDTDYQGDPAKVVATAEDVNYLLGVIDTYFPGAKIKKEDIVASYAGVRPLVHDGSDNEGKTSREHTIFTDDSGITFVAGGKYTTYRLMAEQIVNVALKYLPSEKTKNLRDCGTNSPLNPSVTEDSFKDFEEFYAALGKFSKLSPDDVRFLVERHGPEAMTFSKYGTNLTRWQYEAHHALSSTMCLSLVDFYTRRAPLFLAIKDHGLSVLPEIAQVFSERLQWNDQRIEDEKQTLLRYISKELAWQK